MLQYFTRTWSNMRIYYTKVYQEIWVGLALTTYAYYKISYGAMPTDACSFSSSEVKKQWQTNPLFLAIIKWLFTEYAFHDLSSLL
ncbi:unnamed protein product [Natator depressus]